MCWPRRTPPPHDGCGDIVGLGIQRGVGCHLQGSDFEVAAQVCKPLQAVYTAAISAAISGVACLSLIWLPTLVLLVIVKINEVTNRRWHGRTEKKCVCVLVKTGFSGLCCRPLVSLSF